MSTFKVAVETIETIQAHPNADRLEVASLCGMSFQFIVAKGKHRPGDAVVYFPVDAVLPPGVQAALGLTGKLGGPNRDRVGTVNLRGFISQGVVEFPATLADHGLLPAGTYAPGTDLTLPLGVTKFVKPDNDTPDALLQDLPSLISVYDIEGADRHAEVAAALMDVPVHCSEKLEGQNFGLHFDGALSVLLRTNTVVEKPGVPHFAWEAVRRLGLADKVRELAALFPGRQGTLTGEIIGPGCEGNHYRLPTHDVRFFDLRLDGQFVAASDLALLFSSVGLGTAPVLSSGPTLREWLAGRTIREASHGPSQLGNMLREGIVIKPLTEMRHPRIGRLILKQRDPVYLAKTGN